MSSPPRILAIIACSAVGFVTTSAHADAIDGDWCSGASHVLIEGARITTPSRNIVQGEYNRYRFKYVAPAGEPGAGVEINMVMIRGQEIVHLTRTGQTDEPQVWRRCKSIS